MKGLMIFLILISFTHFADADESNNCGCPTLRELTWKTLQKAWLKTKAIGEQEWQGYLHWREKKRAEE